MGDRVGVGLVLVLGAGCGHMKDVDSESVAAAVWVTSEAGDEGTRKSDLRFGADAPDGLVRVRVDPQALRQRVWGIGSSFTESSAFVLAHLSPERRKQIMRRAFGEEGANFALARTTIGSSDFSVRGKYAYVEDPKAELRDFSLAIDEDGFSRAEHPGVVDESYDLLPMIEEALAIKRLQKDSDLRIVASAWTAPPWMKDIQDWYARPSEANEWKGTGGCLLPGHAERYAAYLVRYVEAYRARGVPVWALTPVNEPNGNNGQWESMHFTPEAERDFIKTHLGPRLKASAHPDTKILIYDQNRDELPRWTGTILGDPEAAAHVFGTAVHWYSSTVDVHERDFDAVHARFPNFDIIHTEGCIDDLGKPAPEGVRDPERFQEKDWFGNDAFWWNENATDWAYTATWAPHPEKHPIYTPVHRYARDIIVGLNHWVSGWIDWNLVLDSTGGPNHVGNFCGAPIMVDVDTGEVHFTPIFHVLAQLSRGIRPGDHVVSTTIDRRRLGDDDLHATAALSPDGLLSIHVLNTTKRPIEYALEVGDRVARVRMPANALQTIQLRLPERRPSP